MLHTNTLDMHTSFTHEHIHIYPHTLLTHPHTYTYIYLYCVYIHIHSIYIHTYVYVLMVISYVNLTGLRSAYIWSNIILGMSGRVFGVRLTFKCIE